MKYLSLIGWELNKPWIIMLEVSKITINQRPRALLFVDFQHGFFGCEVNWPLKLQIIFELFWEWNLLNQINMKSTKALLKSDICRIKTKITAHLFDFENCSKVFKLHRSWYDVERNMSHVLSSALLACALITFPVDSSLDWVWNYADLSLQLKMSLSNFSRHKIVYLVEPYGRIRISFVIYCEINFLDSFLLINIEELRIIQMFSAATNMMFRMELQRQNNMFSYWKLRNIKFPVFHKHHNIKLAPITSTRHALIEKITSKHDVEN